MQYRIGRSGKDLGLFPEEEIREGLSRGVYFPSDLGWKEGMTAWVPLSELFASSLPPQASSPPPLTGTGMVTEAGASPVAKAAATPTLTADAAPTAGFAVAALVVGILSLLTCGLMGLGALAAIVCGHLALSKISKSQGNLRGRGLAIGGLVMGYVSLLLAVISLVSFFSAMALPTMGKIRERTEQTKQMANGRQIVTACLIYAVDHGDKMPDHLAQLVESGVLELEELNKLLTNEDGEPVFEYLGAGLATSADGGQVVLRGLEEYSDGKRVIGRLDASFTVETNAP